MIRLMIICEGFSTFNWDIYVLLYPGELLEKCVPILTFIWYEQLPPVHLSQDNDLWYHFRMISVDSLAS